MKDAQNPGECARRRQRAPIPYLDPNRPLKVRMQMAFDFLSEHEGRLRRRLASMTDAETPLDPDVEDLWGETRLRFLLAVQRADAPVSERLQHAPVLGGFHYFLGIANEVARELSRDRRRHWSGFHSFRLARLAKDPDPEDSSTALIASVSEYLDFAIARGFAAGQSVDQIARGVGVDVSTVRSRWSKMKSDAHVHAGR